jgi:hypothetical protein
MIIRQYKYTDFHAMMALFRKSFQHLYNQYEHQCSLADVQKTKKEGTMLVAVDGKRFLGFCGATTAGIVKSTQRYLSGRMDESTGEVKAVKAGIAKRRDESGPILLEQFPHDFGPILPTDAYINVLAVETPRIGTGSALLSAIMDQHKAPRYFASCLSGSGSLELCTKYGYQPIVTAGPLFSSGHALTFVGRD